VALKIKIFEHVHYQDTTDHDEIIEEEMNQFLSMIPENRVVSVVYDYHVVGNTKRPGVTRCTGYIVYKT
jgi:hypothetical protein